MPTWSPQPRLALLRSTLWAGLGPSAPAFPPSLESPEELVARHCDNESYQGFGGSGVSGVQGRFGCHSRKYSFALHASVFLADMFTQTENQAYLGTLPRLSHALSVQRIKRLALRHGEIFLPRANLALAEKLAKLLDSFRALNSVYCLAAKPILRSRSRTWSPPILTPRNSAIFYSRPRVSGLRSLNLRNRIFSALPRSHQLSA